MSEQKNKNDGYVSIATKVPIWIADLLTILAKQRGMEVYELLQLLVNGFITAAKNEGPMTPETRLLLDSLNLDVAFCKAFNFASPTARNEIAQIILVLQQQGKHGFGLVMIDKPFMGDAKTTYCVDDILERITEVSMRGLYKMLRQIGVEIGSTSLRETLTVMCDAQTIAHLEEMDRQELPGYGEHHDYGRQVIYGQKYKRKPKRTPDSVEPVELPIHFEPSDVPDLPELQDWEGEHRQTEEPPTNI